MAPLLTFPGPQTNRYASDTAPWDLVKSADPEARTLLHWVIFNCAEALRIAAILLQPVMPTKAAALLDELGVKPKRRTVQYAHMGKDNKYGTQAKPYADDGRIKKWQTIFPPTPHEHDSDEMVMEALRGLLRHRTRNRMNQMAEMLAMESRMGEEAVQKLLLQPYRLHEAEPKAAKKAPKPPKWFRHAPGDT